MARDTACLVSCASIVPPRPSRWSEPAALDDYVRIDPDHCAGLAIAIANLPDEPAAAKQARFSRSKVPNLPNKLALSARRRHVTRPNSQIRGQFFERPESLLGEPRHDAKHHSDVRGYCD